MTETWLVLPATVDGMLFMLLAAASFVSSLITAAFGIGGGGILLAVMATLVPTTALIPVHGVVQLGSNAGRMLLLLRFVSWPALPGFAAGALGTVIGRSVLSRLDDRKFRLALNTLLVLISLHLIWSGLGAALS